MRQSIFCGLLLVTAVIILCPIPAAGFNLAMDYWLGSSAAAGGGDGDAYAVGSNTESGGTLNAVDSQGNKKWEFKTESQITTSPAVGDDGKIHFGTNSGFYTLGGNGILHNIFNPDKPVTASPAIDRDGNVYYTSYDHGTKETTIHCIGDDGNIKWEKTYHAEHGDPVKPTGAPVIGPDGKVYFGLCEQGDIHSVIFRADGNGKIERVADRDAIFQGPVSFDFEGNMYIKEFNGSLNVWSPDFQQSWVIEPDSSSLSLKPESSTRAAEEAGGAVSCPVIDVDGTIYFAYGNKFYAFTRNGVKKWDYTAGGEIKATAAIGADGIIYFGASDGWINMLNRQGTLVGWFDAGSAIEGSPTLAANGKLYFGAANGKLYGLGTSSPGLAKSAWPMLMHDPGHTGRAARRISLPFLNLLLSINLDAVGRRWKSYLPWEMPAG